VQAVVEYMKEYKGALYESLTFRSPSDLQIVEKDKDIFLFDPKRPISYQKHFL
jgi:hypothetical protein